MAAGYTKIGETLNVPRRSQPSLSDLIELWLHENTKEFGTEWEIKFHNIGFVLLIYKKVWHIGIAYNQIGLGRACINAADPECFSKLKSAMLEMMGSWRDES